MENNVIACELHDFVEVACMYQYQLRLTLKDGRIVEGKAVDIIQSTDKSEWLVVENDIKQQVDLMTLSKMQVLTPNANFTDIDFDKPI